MEERISHPSSLVSLVLSKEEKKEMSLRGIGLLSENSNRNSASLDVKMFNLCYSVHFGNNMTQACRRNLFDSIFNSGPEFYWNLRPIKPRYEFQQVIKSYWIDFCKSVMDWIMIAGIVPIAFEKRDGNLVPIVPKGRLRTDFDIQIVNKGGSVTYQFVKLRSRKTGDRITPKVDKKVFIRGGFGWDPTEDGKLRSIISTIITSDYTLNMITQYMLLAEYNRSNPELVTETSNETLDLKGPQYGYYGDWDRNQYQEEAKYRLNSQEIAAAMEHQRMLQQMASAPTLTTLGEPLIDRYKKQSEDNLHPLPLNHKLVRQNMPESRTDWVEMNRHIESVICAGMGVSRSFLIQDVGMSETSVRLAQDTYAKTVNGWKTILSNILTTVYNAIYYEDDCRDAMCSYTKMELESMSEDDLFDKAKDPRVTVGFSLVPVDTMEGLITKFALGVLDWDNFRQMALLMGGYPTHLVNQSASSSKKDQDPWQQEYKLNLVRTMNASALNRLGAAGTVIFPPQKAAPMGPADQTKKKRPASEASTATDEKAETEKAETKKQKKQKKRETKEEE